MERALLDVRVLPWRPRARVMKPGTLRDIADPAAGADDLGFLVVSLVLWIVVIVAAPILVLVLAAGLLTVEIPLAIALGVILVLVRFVGIVPWTVAIDDQVTGATRTERYRNLLRAVRRVREINGDRRVQVRWAWV